MQAALVSSPFIYPCPRQGFQDPKAQEAALVVTGKQLWRIWGRLASRIRLKCDIPRRLSPP